ncbi:uncharacterized protein LOC142765975 [Rhipicephalus microplus]|uniref:uncharacterized protein LOC142765975 n=1 Tax=Rhipicephalus microplus TaxID=6941 RepID=UPI003F6C512C
MKFLHKSPPPFIPERSPESPSGSGSPRSPADGNLIPPWSPPPLPSATWTAGPSGSSPQAISPSPVAGPSGPRTYLNSGPTADIPPWDGFFCGIKNEPVQHSLLAEHNLTF